MVLIYHLSDGDPIVNAILLQTFFLITLGIAFIRLFVGTHRIYNPLFSFFKVLFHYQFR
jgi:hypothetical protein